MRSEPGLQGRLGHFRNVDEDGVGLLSCLLAVTATIAWTALQGTTRSSLLSRARRTQSLFQRMLQLAELDGPQLSGWPLLPKSQSVLSY